MNKFTQAYINARRKPRTGLTLPITNTSGRDTHPVEGNVSPFIRRTERLSPSDLYQNNGWNIAQEAQDNERRMQAENALRTYLMSKYNRY